jgi:diguanylate cyclase (GGDEF)-like protein
MDAPPPKIADAIVEVWLEQASNDPFFGTMYIDIDRLMLHNDCFGHIHGDCTIEKIFSCVQLTLQSVNLQFARVGGDEFVVVLRGEKATSVFELADTVRKTVELLSIPMVDEAYCAQYPLYDARKPMTVSIGSMLMRRMNDTKAYGLGSWILQSARESVYLAKLAGRNKVVKIDLR